MIERSIPVLYGKDYADRVQPLLVEKYQTLVKQLWAQLPTDQPPPRVHIVHTPVAKPMIARDKNGVHLVYDQYLGQVFNQLTRVELLDAPPVVVDAYTFKLFGQRLLLRGRRSEALAMALISKSVRESDDHQNHSAEESAEVLFLRGMVVLHQETFAIAHELIHVFLESQLGDKLRSSFEVVVDNFREEWESQLELLADDRLAAKFSQSLDEDFAKARERRGRPITGPPSNKSQFADEGDVLDTLRMKKNLERLDDADFLEEGICDHFGAIIAAKAGTGQGDGKPLSYGAATLGLLHLRFIQYLDKIVENPDELSHHLDDSLLRVSLLRSGLSLSLSLTQAPKGEMEAFQQLAQEFSSMHSRVVFDQTVSCVNLSGLAKDFAESLTAPDLQGGADMERIRSLLGFGPVPKLDSRSVAELLEQRLQGARLSKENVDRVFRDNGGTFD